MSYNYRKRYEIVAWARARGVTGEALNYLRFLLQAYEQGGQEVVLEMPKTLYGPKAVYLRIDNEAAPEYAKPHCVTLGWIEMDTGVMHVVSCPDSQEPLEALNMDTNGTEFDRWIAYRVVDALADWWEWWMWPQEEWPYRAYQAWIQARNPARLPA